MSLLALRKSKSLILSASDFSTTHSNCLLLFSLYFSCGGVVCDGCSKKRLPLPHKGMPFPERVCDPCFFSPPPLD